MGNNTMVGGYTQYLTRVQGMPKEVVKKIKKITDDFVHAKHGEQKANTIATTTLYQDKDLGGLGLLDLEARNEAINVIRLKTYLTEGDDRPQWCRLADMLLGEAAVKKYQNVGTRMLRNPFTQKWKVNLAHRDLPENLRQMTRTAYKYRTGVVATSISRELKLKMPYWYHIGNVPKLKSRYGDPHGECQRTVHNIYTVKDMYEHAIKHNSEGCSKRKNCKCDLCRDDRERGCPDPTRCRKNAVSKLDNLGAAWDPRRDTEEAEAREEARRVALGPPPAGYVRVLQDLSSPTTPEGAVRIFTKPRDSDAPMTPTAGATESATQTNGNTVEVYTDGSCHNNGTADAQCGSGLWYAEGDERNTSARIGPPLEQTNNTGELVAVLLAIQRHKLDTRLLISSDSQYTIDAVTKHAPDWVRKGFNSVKNMPIIAAIVGELTTRIGSFDISPARNSKGPLIHHGH